MVDISDWGGVPEVRWSSVDFSKLLEITMLIVGGLLEPYSKLGHATILTYAGFTSYNTNIR